MSDYYFPSNQDLTGSQITTLLQSIFSGPDTQYADQYAADMTSIGGAEGGGATGIVVNTAFPNAPDYETPYQKFGAGAGPEYSIGLFGEDILFSGNYNLVAQVLGEPQLPAGQDQPTQDQAQSLGAKFAANPAAQAEVTYRMYQNAGNTFQPWTDPVARSIDASGTPGPLPSGETVSIAGVANPSGGGSGGGGGGGGGGSGGTAGTGSSDPFTNFCQQLNLLMHPEFTFISLIKPSSYEALIVMFLVRGAFAVGFAAVGIIGAMKLASGGKVGARDLPSMVAGFLAGPEAGAMNIANKMFGTSLRPTKQPGEMEQARLALGQQRLDFQQRKGYVSAMQRQQQLMQQAARQATQQQQFQQRSQERAAQQAQQAGQFQTRMQENQARRQQSAEQFDARQQAAATRFQASNAARVVGLQQGAQRIQQAGRRGDIAEASLAQRVTAQRSQARARGTRERRLSRIQDFREAAFPQQMGIQQRRQTSAEQRVQLRRETLDFNKWKAGFPSAIDDYYDEFTVAEED